MKKQFLLLAILSISTTTMAGSIDYLSQQDSEYFAHPSLTGKIGVSGAYYNPAGTTLLENGTYIQVNTQTHIKTYEMSVDNDSYKSDKATPLIPSMQLVHVNNKKSYFLHTGVIGGGGNVAYKGGLGTFNYIAHQLDEKVPFSNVKFLGGNTAEGSSYYLTVQGGIAQELNENWSIAGGLRYVNATRTLKGKGRFQLDNKLTGTTTYPVFDIDSERTAQGVTGILGLNYHPNDKLNIGFRYEGETYLNFKTKEKNLKNFRNDLGPNIPGNPIGNVIYDSVTGNSVVREWTDNARGKRNLPAMASLGISYKVSDKVTLLTSGNYYFIKDAGDDFEAYKGYSNGYEIAFGIDYILNQKWTLMGGYQFTDTGANGETYKDTDYALNADLYGIGAKYKYSDNLELMGSLASVFYHSGTSSSTGISYKKHVESIGLSATYKFK
ncbi:MAG: OmpP1/FadL family transporter [Fusobacteriaceae bacterium]